MGKIKVDQEVFLEDIMYLPIQYHRNIVEQPSYKGRGVHSVKELEDICEQYKEYMHQQTVIKQNLKVIVLELKFGVKRGENM